MAEKETIESCVGVIQWSINSIAPRREVSRLYEYVKIAFCILRQDISATKTPRHKELFE
jgi:hypothetical protein